MSKIWWLIVVWWENRFGDPGMSRWWEYHGYRRARGGFWGQWEFRWMGKDTFKMWWPSPCEHYPQPPTATSTEPLLTEDYVNGDKDGRVTLEDAIS